MKKILFISYAFPPMGGGGIFRIIKFIKYLPDFDILPRVLTVANPHHPTLDKRLLQEIPSSVKVTRVSYNEPARRFKTRFWQSFLNYIWYPWFSISDPRIPWYEPGLKAALEIVKKEKIDTIFTSFASATDHLIALEVKRQTGVYWVADFRDEWTSSNYYRFPTSLHRARVKNLEKKMAMAADIITTVSAPITDYFSKVSGNNKKCITITNGFDEEDLQDTVQMPKRHYCQILYSGALYGDRRSNTFNKVIEDLHLPDLKVEFLGGKKHIEHTKAIRLQRQADILLLILSPKDHPAVFTGKIFEYLAARRPILALSPQKTEAAKLIKRLKIGEVVSPTDKNAIKTAILKFYQKYKNHQLVIPQTDISTFDRRNLTAKLAEIFKLLANKTKNLQICLVVNGQSPQSAKLCQYLVKRGYEIHYVNLTNTPLHLPGIKNYWIRQEINPAWGLLKSAAAIFNKLRALRELKQIIKRIKPDIVHGHGLNFAGILAVYSGFHPTIVTTRGSDVMQIDKFICAEQYLIRQTLKKADVVTGSSEALQNQSLKLGMPPEKFSLVYFGIDGEVFKKKNVDNLKRKLGIKKEKMIFCPRSISHIYNIDILIRAVSKLKEDFKLILIKQNLNPEYWVQIQDLIKELNLGKKIILLPQTDPKGMADLYNLADVVISLAQSDGLAVSFLEAMACEKKIVISNVGFVKEWSFDYAQDKNSKKNFWVVPIGDIIATTEAIENALAVPSSKFAPIGRANRQLILARAELNKGFEKMEEVYRDVSK